MTRPLAALTLVLLAVVGAGAAAAQDEPTSTNDRVLFCMGAETETCYELDPSVAVNACIEVAAEDAVRGTETVLLRLIGRTTEPGQFEVLGDLETAHTDDLGRHPVGYCIPLGDRS